jgi:hypothetical protein
MIGEIIAVIVIIEIIHIASDVLTLLGNIVNGVFSDNEEEYDSY